MMTHKRKIGTVLSVAAASSIVGLGVWSSGTGQASQRSLATPAELRQGAERDGFAGSSDPIQAWVAKCLSAQGIDAKFDESSGVLTYTGTGEVLRGCYVALGKATLSNG